MIRIRPFVSYPHFNEVSVEDNDAVRTLLAATELLQDIILSLNKKNKALESSTTTFVEEVFEDLQQTMSGNFVLLLYFLPIFLLCWCCFFLESYIMI